MLALGLGSTVIAFYLQIRGQARLSPTVGSILCLLESPFAMIFAILLLSQMPTGLEYIGAAFIFIAAAGASLKEPVRD
jgi:drug/metabolite transporter (DMT)-like permease